MREPLARHQIIQYQPSEPFYIVNINSRSRDDLYVKNSHWHEELELLYVLRGASRHFIDGEIFITEPGRLLVTNCESIHRIEPLEQSSSVSEKPDGVVLIVHNRFVEENFPEYQDFWFTNDKPQARPEVREIMLKFSEYAARKEHEEHEHLYMRGLLLQLLYYLYQEGSVRRSDTGSIRRREQVQILKEILQYVEEPMGRNMALIRGMSLP